MSPSNKTYLITGANRGIGHGLVAHYLALPSTTIVATVRDPKHPSSLSLSTLPTGRSSRLIVVKIDAKSPTDPAAAVESLTSQYGITHLDVVVANAGICTDFSTVAGVPPAVLREHVEVNGYGVLYLYQAVVGLLKKAERGMFVSIGSPLGSTGGMDMRPYPMAAYGASKALQHWLVRKIHFDEQGLVAFVLDPGFVQTDLGNAGAQFFGMEKATDTLEDSVAGCVSRIDSATREKTSGRFAMWTGEEFPW